MIDIPRPESPQGKMRGGHDPRAMALRSAQVRRERGEERRERERQAREDEEKGLVEPGSAQDTGNRTVLVAIRDDPKALNADRIRAADALRRLDEEARGQGDNEVARVLAWRDALAQLPVLDRLGYLREQRGQEGAIPRSREVLHGVERVEELPTVGDESSIHAVSEVIGTA